MSVRTFLLMGLIRSLDCYRNVRVTFSMWWSMIAKQNMGKVFTQFVKMLSSPAKNNFLGLSLVDCSVITVGVITVAIVSSMSQKKSVRERLYEKPVLMWVLCGLLFFTIILFGAYGMGYDASQFIYDQF